MRKATTSFVFLFMCDGLTFKFEGVCASARIFTFFLPLESCKKPKVNGS